MILHFLQLTSPIELLISQSRTQGQNLISGQKTHFSCGTVFCLATLLSFLLMSVSSVLVAPSGYRVMLNELTDMCITIVDRFLQSAEHPSGAVEAGASAVLWTALLVSPTPAVSS